LKQNFNSFYEVETEEEETTRKTIEISDTIQSRPEKNEDFQGLFDDFKDDENYEEFLI